MVVEGLSKSFPTTTEPLRVLRELSISLEGGESTAIVGPSGSGKSTLLQILGTLDQPDHGKVTLDDCNPFELSAAALARFRNEKIGFVFQDHHLLPQLTVGENVLVPTLAAGRTTDAQRERAGELIAAVGLANRVDHLPGQLSGGERERVAIARAMIMAPSLILADEPTGNLDRHTAEQVTELLLKLQTDSRAILVCVTHSESLAHAMQGRLELVDGRLVGQA
ncbi:MAG: ABC transporter ATP-binding protein [Planctomycetota bacterium]